jgi:hypothetical protein
MIRTLQIDEVSQEHSAGPPLTSQSAMNRSTRGQWELYADHRGHVERLIVPARPDSRMCVLGAGNCNDLDLRWLTQAFAEVHLVDLDETALARAVRRQKCEGLPQLRLHAPVDLSAAAKAVEGWSAARPDNSAIDQCIRLIQSSPTLVARALGVRPFDLVLSPCVLSQLIVSFRDLIGSEHPRYPELRAAIRAAHLRMMAGLLNRGGRGVLLVDVASTDNFPDLARVEDDAIDDLMRTLIRDGKCFRPLTPAAIRSTIQSLEDRDAIGRATFTRPWRWRLGLSKAFLVYAACFLK